MIAFTIIFLVLLAAKLWQNVNQWEKGIVINHKLQMAILTGCMIPAMWILAMSLDMNPIIALFVSTFAICSWWWILFDGLYNMLRGEGFFSIDGSDEGNEEPLQDRFLKKIGYFWAIALKVGLSFAAFTIVRIYLK